MHIHADPTVVWADYTNNAVVWAEYSSMSIFRVQKVWKKLWFWEKIIP